MCLNKTHDFEGGLFHSFPVRFLDRVNLPVPHVVDQQHAPLGCSPVSWKGANRETRSVLIINGLSEVEITSQHPTLQTSGHTCPCNTQSLQPYIGII
jgi:hypothetical protein